jgi:putative ABC transport system ATP-binding protein
MKPMREQRERAQRSLEMVGLAARADHTPSRLSGGQQQRVAIARALVNDPQVVLADEPTGNLDTRTSTEIMGLFQSLNDKGITIAMVTHELDIAHYAKRMIVMRDGVVKEDRLIENRLRAETELARLNREEAAVALHDGNVKG